MSDPVPVPLPEPVPEPVQAPPLVTAMRTERDSLAERAVRMHSNAADLEKQVFEIDAALAELDKSPSLQACLDTLLRVAKRAKL